MGRAEEWTQPLAGRRRAAARGAVIVAALVLALLATVLIAVLLRTARERIDESVPRPGPAATPPGALEMLPPVSLPARRWAEWDDPASEAWRSEAFSDRASSVLSRLAALLSAPDELATADLGTFVAPDFVSTRLYPESLSVVYEDALLRVESAAAPQLGGELRGPESLRAELRLLAERAGTADTRASIKVVGVEDGPSPRTRQLVSVSGGSAAGHVEVHAVWSARWDRWDDARAPAPPRLTSLAVADFERSTLRGSTAPWFQDATAAALGENDAYAAQFLHGWNHWCERLQDHRVFSLLGTPGLALGDVNGDGLDDLYVCQEGGLPNRLFVARADGTASDATERSRAGWLDSTRSALLADLDNDGDTDLAAAVLGALVLAENDGSGIFTRRAALPTSHDAMSLSASDYDLDGDLDLYLCAYNRDDLVEDSSGLAISSGEDIVYHDADTAAPNQLLRNDGTPADRWRFADATRETGLDENNRRFSFAAAWEDYDGDGDQDLYVANDFGPNNLYRNDRSASGSRFTDVAAAAGAEDRASGMSVSWSDYDRDGDPDLYVGNMYSAAGNRITYQESFKPEAPAVRARIQRFARGNSLFRNTGEGAFEDVTEASGTAMGRWAWSSPFVDINNDGWDDIAVANGYLTTADPGDL